MFSVRVSALKRTRTFGDIKLLHVFHGVSSDKSAENIFNVK